MAKKAEDLLADLNDLPDDPDAVIPETEETPDEASIDEFLAEFTKERPSRPLTPRTTGSSAKTARASPRLGIHSDKSKRSGETARASIDSKRSNKDDTTTFTNSSLANSDHSEEGESSSRTETPQAGSRKVYGNSSSWSAWGGSLWSTANTIKSQLQAEAEKRIADLQASEEAKALQNRFKELDLTNLDLAKIATEARNLGQGVLDAVAPPIEGNETLIVEVIHHIIGLNVEESVYAPFERVMDQVEGGSLKIIAKDETGSLNVSAFTGSLAEAKKLTMTAITPIAKTSEAVEGTSRIYLSIQAFTEPVEEDHDDTRFLISLLDPQNSIQLATTSQSFTSSWQELSLITVEASLQPRQWIQDWLQESLSLAVGVLAQRYVAKRMAIDPADATSMSAQKPQDLSEVGVL